MLRRRFSSIRGVFEFEVTPREGGHPISGTVERIGSRWVFGRTTGTQALAPRFTVDKGFWDTFFDVYVTPDTPATIRLTRSRGGNRAAWLLGVLVVVSAAAVLIVALAR